MSQQGGIILLLFFYFIMTDIQQHFLALLATALSDFLSTFLISRDKQYSGTKITSNY